MARVFSWGMHRTHPLPLCALALLVLVGCDRFATPLCPLSPAECAADLDALDQEIVEQLALGTPPEELLEDRQRLLADLETALTFDNADRETMQVLAGLYLSAKVREGLGNASLLTELPSMNELRECRNNLSLGRHFARYARSLAEQLKGHGALVIAELNNAALCLSARQLERFVAVVGQSAADLTTLFSLTGQSTESQAWAVGAILQPAWTVFDLSQQQGGTPLHAWLSDNVDVVATLTAAELDYVLLHDRFSDGLFAFDSEVVAALAGELVDPRKIGRGQCGLSERVVGARESGDGGCGRGLGCGPETTGAEQERNAARVTPFGLGFAEVSESNCSSSGGSPNGDGSASGPFGAGGYAACMLGSVMTGHKNVGQCVIAAAKDGYAASQVDVLGSEGPSGLPVVRRARGNDECATNPYASGHANSRTQFDNRVEGGQTQVSVEDEDGNKTWLDATDTGQTASQLGSRDVVAAYLDENSSQSALVQDFAVDSSGSAKVVTVEGLEEQTGAMGKAGIDSNGERVIYIDQAVWEQGGGTASDGNHYTNQQLVTHEWTHHADYAAHGAQGVNNEDEVRENDRKNGGVGSGEDQMPADPDNPGALCGPEADAMREMMECYGHGDFFTADGSVAIGDDELSPSRGNASPSNTDPSEDQWSAAYYGDGGALACAMDGNVAIDGRGNLFITTGNDVSRTCKLALCEPGQESCACLGQTRGYLPAAAYPSVAGIDCRLVSCAENGTSPCCGGSGDVEGIIGALPDLGGPEPRF